MMKNNIRLILHGHQHVPIQEVAGEGNRIIHVLATGSAGLDGATLPETSRRYQIIQIDHRSVRVYRRSFDNVQPGLSGKGCWKPDLTQNASVLFDSFTISGLPETEPEKGETEEVCDIPQLLEIPESYREWVFEWFGHMEVDRLQEKGAPITISLPEVFVNLYTTASGDEGDIDDLEALLEIREPTRDVEDVIAKGNDLIIKGGGIGENDAVETFCIHVFQGIRLERHGRDSSGACFF